MRIIFTLFVFVISVAGLSAQDPHFSQFYASPANINPAMTGVFEGKFRAMVNYRSQWGSFLGTNAFRTYSAAADFKLLGPKNDFWGVGGSVLSDNAGTLGYGILKGDVGFTYQKMLGRPKAWKKGSNFLTAGAQLGFGQRKADWNAIRTSVQYDTLAGEWNGTSSTGEFNSLRNSRGYMDLSLGLMYYSVTGARSSYYFGASAQHLNQPVISLTSSARDKLYMRLNVHGGAEILLGKYRRRGASAPISILPGAILMMQGPSMEINAGLGFKYKQDRSDDIAFRTGFWLRNVSDSEAAAPRMESAIINAAVEFNRLQIGFSYDINVSKLSAATNSRGAFEVSVIYINPTMGKKQTGCPTFN